ncbi:MAG: hypothetical protein KatS3mg012_0866 [Gaiellaceae bacterium]|jgi:hypothetical protein|nr:MAG: hypothetical protein KatS3mg012_0866 [Gaiellaceae bacterium]
MRSRLRLLALAVPIAALGVLAAHGIAYRIAEPSTGERAALLAQSGHGYLAAIWLALLVVLAVGLAIELVLAFVHGPCTTHVPCWPFVLLAPGGYLLQEHSERLLAGAGAGSTLAERAVLVGLALQLPFALATWLLARLVLGASSALAAARIGTPRPAPRSEGSLPCPASRDRAGLRDSLLAGGAAPRAPPHAVSIA